MTTEFSIAVCKINKDKCHGSLFNDFNLLIDTNGQAKENNDGRWVMEDEASRYNIYLWGTDRRIDDAILGLPGNDSYLSVPKSVDSVLGELQDEDLEARDRVQEKISRELKWNMNMQSQEWHTGILDKPTIDCRYGNIYADDHHFESLTYCRMPVNVNGCDHTKLSYINEDIFSDLYHIVQNTIYIIDYSYKIKMFDNKPYRYPIGVIFPYRKIHKDKFTTEKKLNCFKDKFNDIVLINDAKTNYILKGDTILSINDEKMIQKLDVEKYHKETKNEEDISDNEIFDLDLIKIYGGSNRDDFKQNEIRVNEKSDYIAEESNLEKLDNNTILFNGALEHALKKEIKDDKIVEYNERIPKNDLKKSDDIQVLYDKIKNQDGNTEGKWLDIKQSTYTYYYKNNDMIMGYGPLKIEGALTASYMDEMTKDDKYSELIKLLYHDDGDKEKIIVDKLCKLFYNYSVEHPNNRIIFDQNDNVEVCRRFTKAFNVLFNHDVNKEKESIGTINKEKWVVHPVNIKAFEYINGVSTLVHRKNIAKLGILLSQVYGGYVDNDCPIHTIRGGMMYANSFFGDVYQLLLKEFTWDIYKSDNKMGWNVPKNKNKIRPLVRMNVYLTKFIRGRAGICWNIVWGKRDTVDVKYGYPHFTEEIQMVQSEFKQDYINKAYQQLINVNSWDEVNYELDNLLIDKSQFHNKKIEDDFYLDDKGLLITPDYYGEQILYNVIANCNYKCVSTNTNQTDVNNKNEFKHSQAQRLITPDNWFYPFQEQYDSALICEGQALSTRRQIRGRLERTFVDIIGRDSQFREFINTSEKEIIDNQCPITYQSSYVPWKFYTQLFSLYVNYMPYDRRKEIQKMDKIKVFPNIQLYNIDYNVKSICDAIYSIFICGFNAKVLNNSYDTYILLRNIQASSGQERLHILKNMIPALYNLIINESDHKLDNYFLINFLFLITCGNINTHIIKNIYIPICYCRNSNILITSIKIQSNNMKSFLSNYVPYLSRFYGLYKHEVWDNENDVLTICKQKALDFFIGKVFVSIPKELSLNQTKEQNLAMWVGSKCGGVSEAILIFQAITRPSAGYFLILLGDKDLSYDNALLYIYKIYERSIKSCMGIVLCKIANDKVIDYKVKGDLKVRKMQRDFWGLKHDMILIKTENGIFGNPHIVTKLMNI
uniref:Outer capsid protein VP2 n=1 Tax=Changuinola virus TaxID=40052 RepID=U5YJ44_9REOV|nr:outer capsid protein VP2 [Changuinola virus]